MPAGAERSAERSKDGTYPHGIILLLSLVYLLHAIDRHIIAVVMEPLKHEFELSDKMLGVLGGSAYAVFFALACLPMGWLIDRTNRVRLLAVLFGMWSSLTALSGFATSYVMLLFARAGVGVAEAGGSPTIMSLISDYCSPSRRSSAIGLCYMSAAVGISMSFLIGSAVAASYGWRAAFWMAGAPGIFLAFVLVAVLREPKRGGLDDGAREAEAKPPIREVFTFLTRNRALFQLTIAVSLTAMVMTTLWIWVTSMLMRSHGMELSHVGLLIGVAAICQAVGSFTGGMIGDRAVRGRHVSNYGYVAAGTVLISVPLGFGLAFAPNIQVAIGCLCGIAFFLGGWQGPAFGLSMSIAPARMRGVTAALIQLFANIIGAGIGPFFAGALSDAMDGDLRYAMAAIFSTNLWAALHYCLAARAARPMAAEPGGAMPAPAH